MDEREIAASGAAYKARVTHLFRFLVDEFGFEPPIDAGGQYSHALAYKHRGHNLALLLTSNYHPVDHGFDVTLYPADGPWHGDSSDLIFHTPKEHQDRDFQFLVQGALALRASLTARWAAHGSYQPLPPPGSP